jgi:hypothetical protein
MAVIGSVYFIVYIILTILSLLTIDQRGKKYTNISLFISFLILVLLAGLRKASPDQEIYAFTFHNTQSLFSTLLYGANEQFSHMEVGFLVLLSAIKALTADETLMFIILAGIIIGPVIYASKRLSPYPVLSILIYFCWFYYSNLGALRHALISSLLLLTIVFVVNNKFVKTWALYMTSVLFHKAGLFIGIVYLVKKIKPIARTYFVLLIISLSIAVFGGIFILIFDLFSDYLPENWSEKFYLYVALSESGSFDTNFAGSESILKGSTFKPLFVVCVSLLYFSALRLKFSNTFDIIFGLYISSIFLMFIFIDFKIVSDRVSNYLAISEIILLPMVLSIVAMRDRIFILFAVLGFMFIQLSMLYGNQLYLYKMAL